MSYRGWNRLRQHGGGYPRGMLIGIIGICVVGIGLFGGGGFRFLADLLALKNLPRLQPDSSWLLLVLLGVLTSVHCLAMCGGWIVSMGVWLQGDEGKRNGWPPALLYHGGRLLSYTLSGGVAGGFGQLTSFSGGWKAVAPLGGGILMLLLGLDLLGWCPLFRKFRLQLPGWIGRRLGHDLHGCWVIGLLSALLPCGPLQTAQLYAMSTGNFYAGAAAMAGFALGTVPLLLAVGAGQSLLNRGFAKPLFTLSALLVVFLGLGMVGRGLALAGVPLELKWAAPPAGIAVLHGGYQTVRTEIAADHYQPIVVQKGIPVRWTIRAAPQNLNGCNNAILIPKFNLTKDLRPGDNLIIFTPGAPGVIAYTCWMGMIKSKITVVDDLRRL